jgi:hypothetical protein
MPCTMGTQWYEIFGHERFFAGVPIDCFLAIGVVLGGCVLLVLPHC